MSTERLEIVITERGARATSQAVAGIGTAATTSNSAVKLLKQTLGALGLAILVREAVALADAYTNIGNRLQNVVTDTDQLNVVMKELLSISSQTRSSFKDTAELYSRVGLAAKDLGVSQNELLGFTKSLNQAIILSGASAAESSAALIQLSQGMASGTLRGDELRSVLEQLPAVADVIAKGIGVTRGELRQLGADGKITADIILDSFKKASDDLDARFGRTVPTIGQAITVLQNNVMVLFGEIAVGSGATELLAEAILGLAGSLDVVLKAALALGAGLLVAFGPAILGAINAVRGAVIGLTAVIAANPIGFIAVAITSALTALYLFSDEIALTADGSVTLKDAFVTAFNLMRDSLAAVQKFFGQGDIQAQIADVGKQFTVLGSELKALANGIIGLFVGLAKAVKVIWDGIGAAIKNSFFQAMNGITEVMETVLNKIVGDVNKLLKYANLDEIQLFDFGALYTREEESFGNLGERAAKAFHEGFNNDRDYVGDPLANVTEGMRRAVEEQAAIRRRAEEEQAKRDKNAQAGLGIAGQNRTKPPVDEAALKKAQALLKKQADELDNLLRSVDKVEDAKRQLAETETILDREVAKHTISQERANEILSIQKRQLAEQLDPLKAITDEMSRQVTVLGLTAAEQDKANQVHDLTNQLLQQGIILTQAQTDALGAQIDAITAATKADAERQRQLGLSKSILEGIQEPAKTYGDTIKALNGLLADGKISVEQYNTALTDATIAFLDTETDAASGAARALLKLGKEYSDFASQAETAITNLANGLEDAFVQLAKTGKVSFKDLANSVIEDLARMAYRAATSGIFNLIAQGITTFASSYFGGGAMAASPALSAGGGMGASTFHVGGEASRPRGSRVVDPSIFNDAPRLHSGSRGLGAGEVAAILKGNERVYTPEQDAARMGGTTVEVTVINNAPNSEAKTNETNDGRGNKKIEVIIDEVGAAAIRNPSSATSKALKERYALNSTMVARG